MGTHTCFLILTLKQRKKIFTIEKQSPLILYFLKNFYNKKRKGLLFFYFRLLKMSAAAAAMTAIMTAPMATRVDVGIPLLGGVFAGLGEAVVCGVGAIVGAVVCVGGVGICVAAGDGDAAVDT